MEKKFNIIRDLEVIKDGFFCQGCLIGKDKATASPDPRYCQDCYDVLCEVMETDTRWSHSASMPKIMKGGNKG